jgi:hypothetical protein
MRHYRQTLIIHTDYNQDCNFSEIQTKLLQKVEELTLYVIELKKDNALMKKEIEELKKK